MTESDLKKIEVALGLVLPDFYRTTMLNYPFPKDSFVADFCLMNNVEGLLKYAQPHPPYPGITKPYGIGNDGGEEVYFLDVAAKDSQVYVYDHELGKHEVKAKDWNEYLSQMTEVLKEVDEDEIVDEKSMRRGDRWLAIILAVATIIGIALFLYFGFK